MATSTRAEWAPYSVIPLAIGLLVGPGLLLLIPGCRTAIARHCGAAALLSVALLGLVAFISFKTFLSGDLRGATYWLGLIPVGFGAYAWVLALTIASPAGRAWPSYVALGIAGLVWMVAFPALYYTIGAVILLSAVR